MDRLWNLQRSRQNGRSDIVIGWVKDGKPYFKEGTTKLIYAFHKTILPLEMTSTARSKSRGARNSSVESTTTYSYRVFEFPKLQKDDIIQIDPIIQEGNEGVVIICYFYECSDVSRGAIKLGRQYVSPTCPLLYLDASFYYPDTWDLPSDTRQSKIAVLEIHYDNNKQKPGHEKVQHCQEEESGYFRHFFNTHLAGRAAYNSTCQERSRTSRDHHETIIMTSTSRVPNPPSGWSDKLASDYVKVIKTLTRFTHIAEGRNSNPLPGLGKKSVVSKTVIDHPLESESQCEENSCDKLTSMQSCIYGSGFCVALFLAFTDERAAWYTVIFPSLVPSPLASRLPNQPELNRTQSHQNQYQPFHFIKRNKQKNAPKI
ncbi:hypothetical protein OS493_004892 [Desmophyllum pertusum]|uniref:Uncharacterized protein n=1 Tax=Desmophyllum pertusum TaxID=174260 RepID=A0A9W9Z557_9CNID|nr:hypothetical protein OS493_004892 [Desmophyllum pertusum]